MPNFGGGGGINAPGPIFGARGGGVSGGNFASGGSVAPGRSPGFVSQLGSSLVPAAGSALGTVAGSAIGNAIFPGVGGVVGGAIGGKVGGTVAGNANTPVTAQNNQQSGGFRGLYGLYQDYIQ